jgi:dynein heavy chain
MRRSVARSVDDAVRAFAKPDCSRAKWATEHPGQAVLCVSQAFWTLDVERVRAVVQL